MTPRPLLITGCGRSGTKYTATLLSRMGVRCAHEKVFSGRPTDTGIIPPGEGESSWWAVPYMDKVQKNAVVVHQVRHPMGTIRSYVNRGFFRLNAREEESLLKHYAKRLLGRPPSGQYRLIEMVRSTFPEIFESDVPAVRGARFWVLWNQMVETECERLKLDYRRVRLEDIDEALVRTLLDQMHVEPGQPIEEALEAVPKDVNARKREVVITWAEMGDAAAAVRALATRYGYDDLEDQSS